MLSAGQNMAEIQLQRRSRDTELASLGSLARVCVELLASVRPSLSRGGNWFFRDRILCVVTQPLSQPHSHRHSLSHLSGYGSLQICLETMMTVCSLSILVIDKKVLGEGHAPILARLHFLTINVFGSCQRCERPGTAG